LFLTLLDMLRLRSGPQDLPAGWAFASALTFVYVAQGFFADQTLGDGDGAPRSLLAIAVQFIAVSVLLNLKQLPERVPQTLTALAGTGFLFGLMSLLILNQLNPGEPQPGLALFYLGLFFWSLTVDAHIYRSALSIKMGSGVLLAVLIFGLTFVMLKAVFE
jgi:uncharacterized membrane protein